MPTIDRFTKPFRTEGVVLTREGMDSFIKQPLGMARLTDAEFRILSKLYADYAQNRGMGTEERGVTRKSLKTQPNSIDHLIYLKMIVPRGPLANILYLSPEGARAYEIYYYVRQQAELSPREYKGKLHKADLSSTLEGRYLKALPIPIAEIVMDKNLDPYTVYKEYRKDGRQAVIRKYVTEPYRGK